MTALRFVGLVRFEPYQKQVVEFATYPLRIWGGVSPPPVGAAAQVLAAHLVLFGALLLQFCYHPYACNMLDSLQVSKAGRGHFRAGLGLTSLL